MTAKRFTIDNDMNFNNKVETYELNCIRDNENQTFYFIADSIENVQLFVKRLNELNEENEQLKSENNMLKHTIGRNEAYIERITHKGEWSNTFDEEKEVIAYLQAYHQGNVKEIRK